MTNTQNAETWHYVPDSINPGWAHLYIPEAEGFDLDMPEWIAARIITEHDKAAALDAALEALRLLSERGGTEIDTKSVAAHAIAQAETTQGKAQ